MERNKRSTTRDKCREFATAQDGLALAIMMLIWAYN